MSTHLQGTYIAALARIADMPVPPNVRKYTPIFQRDASSSQKQAVKDAATALGALWKKNSPSRR